MLKLIPLHDSKTVLQIFNNVTFNGDIRA